MEELQNGVKEAQKKAFEAILDKHGTLISMELCIEAKTIPYVLKVPAMGGTDIDR